ncbi:MAG: hypothetical protein MZW92_58210 [Comamonadaceae bacterium]|nr:hypothetical protein [Comamonadaceae bacterium]
MSETRNPIGPGAALAARLLRARQRGPIGRGAAGRGRVAGAGGALARDRCGECPAAGGRPRGA